MSLLFATRKKNASSGQGNRVNLIPFQHRFMTYHDEEDKRHYVDFVGDNVGFGQVCKISSLTNVSTFGCLLLFKWWK